MFSREQGRWIGVKRETCVFGSYGDELLKRKDHWNNGCENIYKRDSKKQLHGDEKRNSV